MVYLAHTANELGISHSLKDHLTSVGELASQFAEKMNPAMLESARWASLLHDLAKCREEFQEYLCGRRESASCANFQRSSV